jgi:hypothetical protein
VIQFLGVNIIESDLALEKTNEPTRKHELKNWMSGTYHNRIQKKWNKRFGFVMKPCIYKTRNGFIAHPSVAAQIRKAVALAERNVTGFEFGQ